jgi:hypothetical protein
VGNLVEIITPGSWPVDNVWDEKLSGYHNKSRSASRLFSIGAYCHIAAISCSSNSFNH